MVKGPQNKAGVSVNAGANVNDLAALLNTIENYVGRIEVDVVDDDKLTFGSVQVREVPIKTVLSTRTELYGRKIGDMKHGMLVVVPQP